jgi:hypothetical protein
MDHLTTTTCRSSRCDNGPATTASTVLPGDTRRSLLARDGACVSRESFGAQNPEPPLPLELPPECPAVVVGVVVFEWPPVAAPPLEPQAATTTPKIAAIAIGARRRAILRCSTGTRLLMWSVLNTLTQCERNKLYGRRGARDCIFRKSSACGRSVVPLAAQQKYASVHVRYLGVNSDSRSV